MSPTGKFIFLVTARLINAGGKKKKKTEENVGTKLEPDSGNESIGFVNSANVFSFCFVDEEVNE